MALSPAGRPSAARTGHGTQAGYRAPAGTTDSPVGFRLRQRRRGLDRAPEPGAV